MNKTFLITAALIGALSVALGAFGAHGLKDKLNESALGIFETAVRYQFYHVFALLAVAILFGSFPGKNLQWAGMCFIIGIILFSGSLYALTALSATNTVGLRGIGAITPIGGVFFIVGWVFLFLAVIKGKP